MRTTRAGWLRQAPNEVDLAAFGLSPAEAQQIDPLQLLVLECAHEAL